MKHKYKYLYTLGAIILIIGLLLPFLNSPIRELQSASECDGMYGSYSASCPELDVSIPPSLEDKIGGLYGWEYGKAYVLDGDKIALEIEDIQMNEYNGTDYEFYEIRGGKAILYKETSSAAIWSNIIIALFLIIISLIIIGLTYSSTKKKYSKHVLILTVTIISIIILLACCSISLISLFYFISL